MLEQLVRIGGHGLLVITHEEVGGDALHLGHLRGDLGALLGLLLGVEALGEVGDSLLGGLSRLLGLLKLLGGVLVVLGALLPFPGVRLGLLRLRFRLLVKCLVIGFLAVRPPLDLLCPCFTGRSPFPGGPVPRARRAAGLSVGCAPCGALGGLS